MKLNKKSLQLFSLSLLLSSYMTAAEASKLRVINENNDEIEINVIPEPASMEAPYCWKCLGGASNVSRENVVNIVIPPEAFNGREYFSVVGTTGGFLFNGKCQNLSVYKNYELHFLNDYVGASCISREI